jgi:nucleotide-binding universal stress UspA family protein
MMEVRAMMMQSILVGLDWGETVDAVAATAVELAVALDASVKALYVEDVELIRAAERAGMAVLPVSGEIPWNVPNWSDLEVEFQSEERVLAKRFLRLVGDTRIRGSFLVARGEVPQILVRESRAHDLLVMGKYSEHAAEDEETRPLGRHVEGILRNAWCPVLLVPPGESLGGRFLAVYDGGSASHRALSAAVRLVQATQAELSVLVVAGRSSVERVQEDVQAYLDSHRVAALVQPLEEDPVDGILNEAEEWQASLLTLGAFAQSRSRDLLTDRDALEVIECLECPTLLCGSLDED